MLKEGGLGLCEDSLELVGSDEDFSFMSKGRNSGFSGRLVAWTGPLTEDSYRLEKDCLGIQSSNDLMFFYLTFITADKVSSVIWRTINRGLKRIVFPINMLVNRTLQANTG